MFEILNFKNKSADAHFELPTRPESNLKRGTAIGIFYRNLIFRRKFLKKQKIFLMTHWHSFPKKFVMKLMSRKNYVRTVIKNWNQQSHYIPSSAVIYVQTVISQGFVMNHKIHRSHKNYLGWDTYVNVRIPTIVQKVVPVRKNKYL